MKQGELFGVADLAQPTAEPAPWPAPVPDNIRHHLSRMLSDARYAEVMPWRDWELAALTENFIAMADRLDDQEAPAWKAQWTAEVHRLQRADAA